MPILPIYQRSNITVVAAKNVAQTLGMANLKKILLKGNSVKLSDKFNLLKIHLSRLICKF